MRRRHLKYSAIADLALEWKVSRQAIYKAIKKGTLNKHLEGKSVTVDPTDAKSLAYVARLENSNSGNRREVKAAKAIQRDFGDKDFNLNPQSAVNQNSNSQIVPEASTQNQAENEYKNIIAKNIADSETEKKYYQQARTTKINLEIAKTMNVLIMRDLVEKYFGQFITSVTNGFLYMDDRIIDDLMGIFETVDPAKKAKAKTRISTEIFNGLETLKEKMDKFALHLVD